MKDKIIHLAGEMGFVAAGFCTPGAPLFFEAFLSWLYAGYHARMSWMARNTDIRGDTEKLLPGCRTIICLAYPYSPKKPSTSDGFTVSRYSEPMLYDYHERLKKLGKVIAQAVSSYYPGSKARVCVDSAPVLERSLAFSAGIGFIGKNTSLIIPGRGSYHFLMEIFTTAEIPFNEKPIVESFCSSCSLCMDACPMGALERPYVLNASKCLSYRTIEDPSPVDRKTASGMGRCFLGCDICQEVCPCNADKEEQELLLPSSQEILDLDEQGFKERFGKSALKRAGLKKIKENLSALLPLFPDRI
ncbi:MAG: tRNA epoxyqueuosine(34) reductase QueG [Deltaproteobacteria bacterium CG_4_8_14_3_um_filter_51_11]|nr:tRNA epoxyqueuosine(34) reductase QueG [bacterium]NCP08970.1 tRNA epoxyqueuosine(34) reductase QueG [bacterium]OIP40162.1 MAG: tRNA epoxyqueuosine(34) reductase QueG [Desulfobacteraceae bacterium CG2_30_51_40]PIX18406.1 MAG: tRNA epoxyqueuosine(34) reductase QueG [Deltaproteobacteria bacterium CG_4_8_14_3_um_filter_51_11]PIY25453.1 MAG: tRNA epoxyqueuosine(34) reductase QueG [Deltaproteobacteria bacterium CG_4_10_14_3_um_filter_51_14]